MSSAISAQTDVSSLFEIYQGTSDPARRAWARERLIEAHISLVRYVASRMKLTLHHSVEWQDLVSYGMFGLMDAIERFDAERGASFVTFATYRIQGAITDEMRAQAWEPRSLRAAYRRLRTAASQLEHELGRPATEQEVATAVSMDLDELRRVEREMQESRVRSLSEPAHRRAEGEFEALAEVVTGPEADGFLEAQVGELTRSLSGAIETLPVQDRVLLQLVYVEQMMLKEIAQVLRVTDSWVCHLHTRAMVSLQRTMAGQF